MFGFIFCRRFVKFFNRAVIRQNSKSARVGSVRFFVALSVCVGAKCFFLCVVGLEFAGCAERFLFWLGIFAFTDIFIFAGALA